MMCGIVVSGHRHFLQPSSWVLCICSWIFHCVKSVIDAGSSMNPVNSSTLTPTQSSTSTLIRCSITSLSGRSKPSRTAVCSVIDDACQRLFVVWSFFWLCSFRGFFPSCCRVIVLMWQRDWWVHMMHARETKQCHLPQYVVYWIIYHLLQSLYSFYWLTLVHGEIHVVQGHL